MANSYHIEEADLSECASDIEALWSTNLIGYTVAGASAKLRLGYVDNPAEHGTVLLLYPVGGRVPCGAQGLHPRTFHLGTRRLRVVGLADLAIDVAHRSLGPASRLTRHAVALCAERFNITYSLPNAKAAPVLARVGFKRFGVMRRYAKPLATRDKLTQRMPAWLARCCAPMLDRALGAQDQLRELRLRTRLACLPTTWDDPELDTLWARRPSALLLSERSAAMLRWRFGAKGRADWRACIGRDRHGEARGYVVWRMHQGFAEIGDFFSADPDAWTVPLMLSFARLARAAGAASVSVAFFGRSEVAERLQASGMRLRPGEAPLFKLPGAAPDLDVPEHWYVTAFDNDED